MLQCSLGNLGAETPHFMVHIPLRCCYKDNHPKTSILFRQRLPFVIHPRNSSNINPPFPQVKQNPPVTSSSTHIHTQNVKRAHITKNKQTLQQAKDNCVG